MANKRHKPEEIVTKVRQFDVVVGQGMALLRQFDQEKGCFIEQSLAMGVRIDHRLRHSGDWHDA